MAGRIPDETLQAIRDRTSLVEVISTYVGLKRSGRNYLGLCPVPRREDTLLHRQRRAWLLPLLRLRSGRNRLQLRDAHGAPRVPRGRRATRQARRSAATDIALERSQRSASRANVHAQQRGVGASIVAASPSAAAKRRGATSTKRGVRPEIVDRYQLGFAPPGGSALVECWNRDRSALEVAAKAGLLGDAHRTAATTIVSAAASPSPSAIDATASSGSAGARSAPNNRSISTLPSRRCSTRARRSTASARHATGFATTDRVVLVEGYLDAHRAGAGGTAVRGRDSRHGAHRRAGAVAAAARRRCSDRVLLFRRRHGRPQGGACALSASAPRPGIWGRAVFIPEGFDPDSYVRAHGREAMERLLDAATPVADFYFDQLVPPGAPMPQRAKAAEEVKGILARVQERRAVRASRAPCGGAARDRRRDLSPRPRRTPTPPPVRRLRNPRRRRRNRSGRSRSERSSRSSPWIEKRPSGSRARGRGASQ